ncbi:hypothetical protein Ndes2437B_g08476 [Nannochloris sp. 'desiccata']
MVDASGLLDLAVQGPIKLPPAVGLGTFKSKAQDVKVAVRCALQHGIRHIDTASIYKNETEIGEVIREYINNGSLTRNDLYVTSKVSPFEMKDEATTHAASKAILDRLGLDYVDLMLIHWPGAAKTELSSPENAKKRQRTWRALEELYTKGFARAIGVSNYEIHHLEQLVTYAKVLPVLNQGIFLATRSFFSTVQKIALECPGKTPAQILLCWCLQKGCCCVLPKSIQPERILEYSLDAPGMQKINGRWLSLEATAALDALGATPEVRKKYCWNPRGVV